MVEVSDPKVISEAIVVWTGRGRSSWPSRDEQLLRERFGDEATIDLLPVVEQLEEDFYKSEAHTRSRSVVDMGQMAAADFRLLHPEIADEAVDALAWCYMYDYK